MNQNEENQTFLILKINKKKSKSCFWYFENEKMQKTISKHNSVQKVELNEKWISRIHLSL